METSVSLPMMCFVYRDDGNLLSFLKDSIPIDNLYARVLEETFLFLFSGGPPYKIRTRSSSMYAVCCLHVIG